tara:strand:- start:12472 stop:12831 length:360 start_codon:yes stop_codon:yes gene_type:complete
MSDKTMITMIANEDLDTAQYKLVNVDGDNGVKLRVAAGAPGLGILDNKPKSGEGATVITQGVTRAFAGAAVTAGQFLTSTASGTFTNATSGQYIMGKSITGCASGSLFLLDVQHNGYRG